jgi:hypothetical protein
MALAHWNDDEKLFIKEIFPPGWQRDLLRYLPFAERS